MISDSEPWHVQSEIACMQKHGVSLGPTDFRRYTGGTAWDMFEDLIKRHDLDATVDELFQDKERILFELLEANLKPISGVIDLIKRLKEKGLKLAIGSSGHNRLVDFSLTKFGIKKYFDAIVTGEDVEKGKPAPDIYDYALKAMKLDADECIAFEDSINGIKSSLGANLNTIITINDYTKDHDFSNASIVLDQMGEPGQTFTVIAGNAFNATYLDCDLVVKLHQQTCDS